jgi:predicted nucleic acid-binding protein
MFIDCAVSGKAPYLVSGDRDLLDLKQVMSVRIIDARTFLREHPK